MMDASDNAPNEGREWLTSDFDFDLPLDLIAQTPAEPRDTARLLKVNGAFDDKHIFDLPDLLRPGDLLVVNDTKVIPARLFGRRGEVEVEVLLHKKEAPQTWLAFAKPGKRLNDGDQVLFAPNLEAAVLSKTEDGQVVLRFSAPDDQMLSLLEIHGHPPLPPYIKANPGIASKDRLRYQTIYATRAGAVAAPTAGLHFTPQLLRRLAERGIECATVTLHVGAGTFQPVKVDRLSEHQMHAEWAELTAGTAAYLNHARADGRRIVAVGTTSFRVLESAVGGDGRFHGHSGETRLFVTPGYTLRGADLLLTNFHLPKSTLFMLVCAFAGHRRMQDAYAHAKAKGYRFYSYGDACLLTRPTP